MKLLLMSDVETAMFNCLPYVGREGNERYIGLAKSVVTKLVEPLHKSGINVTTDNSSTSSKHATALLSKQATLLGTVRRTNKKFLINFVL